ncbi:MAG: hypothetical protein DWH79_06320 [Planctomycetota bacterium]|nr:MAG: hypothetical protein DWH79_06320 [Planctomycetota bacterium]
MTAPSESTGTSSPPLVSARPTAPRTFLAILRDTWREFLDAKVLYLLLAVIGLLFGTALTGKIEPQPSGRDYLTIAARSMAADLSGIDVANQSLLDVAGRLNGAVYWIRSAEPLGGDLPDGRWRATLSRTFLPMVAEPESNAQIQKRFGVIADGQLWRVVKATETSSDLARRLGSQTWEMTVEPGRDLKLLWPNQFSLFGGSLDLAGSKGAPLGLEVLILQKLLATGLGGTILLLVCVAVTAAFVPTMIRKGTLELLLVRPIPRWQLLVFKYVSALLLVAGLLGLLVSAVWLITGILAGIWSPGVMLALPSLLVFFSLLLAVSVLTGVITRSVTSAMLVTVAYWAVLFIFGQMHNQVVESRLRETNVGRMRPVSIADSLRGRRPRREEPPKPGRTPFHRTTIGRVSEGIYTLLPHTEDLDNLVDRQLMRDYAVAGPFRALLESPEFSWQRGLGLTLLHTVAYLAIASFIFSRRDP